MKVSNPTPTQIRDAVVCPRRAYLAQWGSNTPASPQLVDFNVFHELNKLHIVPFLLENLFSGQERSLEEIIKAVPRSEVEERIAYLKPDIKSAERWGSVHNFLIATLQDPIFGPKVAETIRRVGYFSKSKEKREEELKQTNRLVDAILDLNEGAIAMQYSHLIEKGFSIDKEGLADEFMVNHLEVVAPAVHRILSEPREEKSGWWLTEDMDYQAMQAKIGNSVIYGRPDFIVFVEERERYNVPPLEVKNKVRAAEMAQNLANKAIIDSNLENLAEKAGIPKKEVAPANYMMFFTYADWAGGEKEASLITRRLSKNYTALLQPQLQLFRRWEQNPIENKPPFSQFYRSQSGECKNCYKGIPCLVEYQLSRKQ